MTAPDVDRPPGDDRLVRVVVNLPRSVVERLDKRTGPGRSRSSVLRDLIAETEGVTS